MSAFDWIMFGGVMTFVGAVAFIISVISAMDWYDDGYWHPVIIKPLLTIISIVMFIVGIRMMVAGFS